MAITVPHVDMEMPTVRYDFLKVSFIKVLKVKIEGIVLEGIDYSCNL